MTTLNQDQASADIVAKIEAKIASGCVYGIFDLDADNMPSLWDNCTTQQSVGIAG